MCGSQLDSPEAGGEAPFAGGRVHGDLALVEESLPGAIGLALTVGARNLPDSQQRLSSMKFRWNISGSYIGIMPRFFSMEKDGSRDERDFLSGCYDSAAKQRGGESMRCKGSNSEEPMTKGEHGWDRV